MIYLIRFKAVILFTCCLYTNPAAAQNAPKVVSIKLPDDSEMRFHAVYLGIDGDKDSLFASKRIIIGANEDTPTYKNRRVETALAGAFIGKRENAGKLDWLYYLGETEVQRSQWNSVLRWMDQQEGKTTPQGDYYKIERQPNLPITGITLAETYRFIDALNMWMLQRQKDSLPALGGARAFCRLPTEAEWEFAARGGIEEKDPDVFNRRHPYGNDLGKYEWNRSNSDGRMRECGSSNLQPNKIGLRDMLGNAEELTSSLFGPEYQQGRFGQFAVRGNYCSDSPDKFSVSHRTEFTPYEIDGMLRRDERVGFRLALSTSIGGSGDFKKLDGDCEKYFSSRALTRPGFVGTTSPSSQSEQDSCRYLSELLEQTKTDKKKNAEELAKIQKQRDSDQKKYSEIHQTNQEILNEKKQLETDISELQKRLAASPKLDEFHILQRQVKEAKDVIERLRTGSQQIVLNNFQEQYERSQREVIELKQKFAAVPDMQKIKEVEENSIQIKSKYNDLSAKAAALEISEQQVLQKLLETENRLTDQSRELTLKEQTIADLGRRQQDFDYEISKNAGRVREVEKRYLEALMRQASASAALGLRNLIKIRHSGKQAPVMMAEATQLIYDYWELIVQMAQETQANIFPQVKQTLAEWLREREAKGGSIQQRKVLNLIERHIAQVRAGNSLRPDGLVDSFPDQPEFK